MDFLNHLPAEMQDFLFGHFDAPTQNPLSNQPHDNPGRPWPSTSGYPAFDYGYEQETHPWPYSSSWRSRPSGFRSRSLYNAFEGEMGWEEGYFPHTQPSDPTHAGRHQRANHDWLPFELRRTFQGPGRMQHHDPSLDRSFRSAQCTGFDDWPPGDHGFGHEHARDHGYRQRPWHQHHNQMPQYTVEDPDVNETSHTRQLPRRARPMGRERMHGGEPPEQGDWDSLRSMDAFARRSSTIGFCWTPSPSNASPSPPHSPPASPSRHGDPMLHHVSVSERGSRPPSPMPERRPSPEHVPYERDPANNSPNPYETQPGVVSNLTSYNTNRLHQKFKRKRAKLDRMHEELLQKGKELALRETRLREREVIMECQAWSRGFSRH